MYVALAARLIYAAILALFRHTCADLEVHKGGDGRCYVIDAARVFPPTQPVPKSKYVLSVGRERGDTTIIVA